MSTKDLSTYVPIFDGTNYKEWYDKLEAFAMAMKCDGPMSTDRATVPAADRDAFDVIDRQMRGMIHLHLRATYQSHVGATARATLTALKTAFGTPGRVGVLVELRSLFQHRMKPNANPIHEANNLIQCAARLSTAGYALADGLIALAILMALPSDWENLVSTLCSTLDDAGFTVAAVTAQIHREYMRRQASRGRSTISLQDRLSERTSLAAEYSDATLVSRLTNVKPAVRPSYQGSNRGGKGKQPVRDGQRSQYPRCVFQGCRRNHFPAEFCPIGRQRIFYDQGGKQICCQPQVQSPPAGGSSNNHRGTPNHGRGGKRGGRGRGKGRGGGGTHVVFDESLQYYDQPDYEEFQDYTAMMVDQPATSGLTEIPVSPTVESLDALLDEYNAERPMAPFSEEAVRALWADESMGPSSFDDIIETFEQEATYDFDRTCALIHIPRIPTQEPDVPLLISHPETEVSRNDWEEIEDEDFVRLVRREDVLCPESSLCTRFWNHEGQLPYMDEPGNIRLDQMSSDVFFLNRTFEGHTQIVPNFRIPRALIVGWSFLGFPAEVHFYSGEVDCDLCNTSHPHFSFRQAPHSESDEAIQMAVDIAKRNRFPPRRPNIPVSSFLTSRDAECILCHSSCTSTLCLDCGRKQKDGSTLILLDSGASRHCTPHFEDFISYKPYGVSKFSTTADKDTFVEKLGLGTVLMLHHSKII